MKWKIEKKYLRIAGITLGIIILAILFNYMLGHDGKVTQIKNTVHGTMAPIVIGCILAYLLNPILNFFEHYCFIPLGKMIFSEKESSWKKFSRALGTLCTIVLFLVLVVGGLYLVIPQVYLSLSKIVTEAPNYYNTVVKWMDSLDPKQSEVSRYLLLGLDRLYSQAITYLNTEILPNMDKIVAGITSGIVGGLKMILNMILALTISIYVMLEKEVLISVGKKLTYSFFSKRNANAIMRGTRYANQVFGGFINGKIIDSFIIGVICYAFMMIVQFDYAVLISMIVGVTNIIPYFGPFIGAIPSALILLMMDVKQGIIFIIFIIILQQMDGNVIGPVILGDRLKISSMWILFAILVGGGFFGVPGMILGAPCLACLYALVGTICKERLQGKGLPIQTAEYYDIDQVAVDGSGEVIYKKNEPKMKSNSKETEKEEETDTSKEQ